MTARDGPHLDVAGYALGTLHTEERARFEAHLRECDACRAELAELAPVARLAAAAPPLPSPPPDLRARTLLAVAHAAGQPRAASVRSATPERRSRFRLARLGVPAAALAAVLLALLIVRTGDDDPGRLEAVATLQAPAGGGEASAEIFVTGIGRVVELDTDDLPILPKGQFYELWFVGPDDRPGASDRISAGTFHPDEQGRSRVSLTAAADPATYAGLAVTVEPGDGDPAPTRPDVLRGRARPR